MKKDRMKRLGFPAVMVSAVLLSGVAGAFTAGSSMANFSDTATSAAINMFTGRFDLAPDGAVSTVVNGKTVDGATSGSTISVNAGDVVEFRRPFITDATQDNLRYVVSVSPKTSSVGTVNVSIVDSAGNTIPVTSENGVYTTAPLQGGISATAVVSITVPGSPSSANDGVVVSDFQDATTAPEPVTLSVDNVSISMRQVRV